MPYYIRDPKRDHNFDNYLYISLFAQEDTQIETHHEAKRRAVGLVFRLVVKGVELSSESYALLPSSLS